ncbi:MAG: hypothetical protein RL375_4803 [Pseudomonadota bacterium]
MTVTGARASCWRPIWAPIHLSTLVRQASDSVMFRRGPGWWAALRLLMALSMALTVGAAWAQAKVEAEPTWSNLTTAEQKVLKPLDRMWPSLDAARKQKWRDIAARYPKMPADQQRRLSERMVEWAGMTPDQRIAARQRYEESKQLPAAERQALWEAYQALPEDERRQLATKAGSRPAADAVRAASATPGKHPIDAAQPKTNLVAPAVPAKPTRSVAPGTVQANAGASTRPITQKPTPPAHQQPGQSKIAATPDLVDGSTLLPQRGTQGAPAEARRASQ